MPGRLSKSSRPTQATGPGCAAAHNATAIVLPAPGGPVTTVSGHHRVPSAISAVIRGRRTAHSGTSGTVILDVRIGSPAGPADRLVRPDPRLATWTAISTSPRSHPPPATDPIVLAGKSRIWLPAGLPFPGCHGAPLPPITTQRRQGRDHIMRLA